MPKGTGSPVPPPAGINVHELSPPYVFFLNASHTSLDQDVRSSSPTIGSQPQEPFYDEYDQQAYETDEAGMVDLTTHFQNVCLPCIS